jgi:hypothetical protein
VEGVFDFPPGVKVRRVYTHPQMSWERMGNRFIIRAWNFPPQTIAEVRFVTDPLPTMPYAASNPTLTLQEVEEVEAEYQNQIRNPSSHRWYSWEFSCLVRHLTSGWEERE